MDPYGQRPRALVLDCGGIGTIDSSGVGAVGDLRASLSRSFQQLRDRRIAYWEHQLDRIQNNKEPLPAQGVPKYLYASETSIQQALDTCRRDPFRPPPVIFTTVRGKVNDRLSAAARYATVISIDLTMLWLFRFTLPSLFAVKTPKASKSGWQTSLLSLHLFLLPTP